MTSQANTTTKVFGAGDVYALVNGLTPVKFGVLQDIEIDISGAVAELYGQYQFPVAAARGKGKISGKAKMGQFDVNLFNSIYYGGTVTSGYNKEVTNEAHNAGSSIPTATALLSSAGITDLGVYYTATGVQLTYSTAAAPTIGNYSVVPATGVYTVSTAEASSTPMLFNYAYQDATAGNQLVVTNQLMGIQPVFQLRMFEGFTDFGGRSNFDIQLNRCIATKMNFPFKNSDFMIEDFEFSAFADSTGGLFTLGTGV